ncbi:MAG: hypothetical protein IJE02_05480 [Clostridia bacterium]|nr:hypothetical protein [Clostridia bacterium]
MGKISEIFNFDNIGGKIKGLAKWSCWITILLIWIVAPIVFIAVLLDEWTADYFCFLPLVAAIIGPVFVWIGSWAMYAFGEFVEDIHAIRNKEGTTKEKAKRVSEEKLKLEAEDEAKCDAKEKTKPNAEEIAKWQKENELSDDDFIDTACPKCEKTLSFLKNETKGICPECGAEFEIK